MEKSSFIFNGRYSIWCSACHLFPPTTHAKTLINTDTLLHDHDQPLSAFFLSAPNRKGSDYKHTAIIYGATAKYPLLQPGIDSHSWRSWPWRANDHWELWIVLWQCQKCKRNISFEVYKLGQIDAISSSLCLSCKISCVWVTELSIRVLCFVLWNAQITEVTDEMCWLAWDNVH